jgi:chemotaxis protein MotB
MSKVKRPPKPPIPDAEEGNKTKTIETLELQPKRKPWGIIIVTGVFTVIFVILGLFLMDAHTEIDEANEKTQKADQALADSRKNLQNLNEEHTSKMAECDEAQHGCEEKIAGLESALDSSKSRFGELRDEKKQAKRELAQFKAFSAQFKRMISSGKLEVVFRRGRMVVNLPAQVLFGSGSAELSEEGKTALMDVAKVLRKVQNKRFIVGGHTDNQKIKRSTFKSNWELSTARAVVVTEALVKAGLKPWNLIAAGYSEYAPIANNSSEEGRQKNRRIEIILEPYLKDISPPKPKKKTDKKAVKKASKKVGKKAGKKASK